jgi:hypothetical protein
MTGLEPDHPMEFQEIGHCGGKSTVNVRTDAAGNRTVQFGISHSRPTAAAFFAIYALPRESRSENLS